MKILSELDADALEAESMHSDVPKWNTLCMLKLLGLSTLDTVYLPARLPEGNIENAVYRFAEKHNLERLLLRSDGGRETHHYLRGGDSMPIEMALDKTRWLVSHGRSVLLMEPTNRFANRLNLTARIARGLHSDDNEIVIEILGAGYDVSDLNRGGIQPHFIIKIDVQSWDEYNEIRSFDVRVQEVLSMSEHERRSSRLAAIGEIMLPYSGIQVNGPANEFAEAWLRANGFISLWEGSKVVLDMDKIREWYDSAFMIVQWMTRVTTWRCLAVSMSKLADGRDVYWDVVNGSSKYGARLSPTLLI